MNSGIYFITCTHDPRIYIGRTFNFQKRKSTHWRELRNGVHTTTLLQKAWSLYGEASFTFVPVVNCLREDTPATEMRFLEAYIPGIELFNIRKGSGIPTLAEIVTRMSEARLGHEVSCSTREKISKALKGRKLSEEHCKNIAEGGKGKVISEATRLKTSQTHTGMKQSEQHRLNNSLCRRGKKFSLETRLKMSAARTGKKRLNMRSRGPHSDETRKRMVEAWIRRRARNQGGGV